MNRIKLYVVAAKYSIDSV